MPHDIIEVRPLGAHRLFLKFDDGVEGTLDLAPTLRFDGVFAPMGDPGVFAQVRLDPEIGTIVWPNGADLCPDVLYSQLTGTALPTGQAREAV
jgi:hypothetical protein